MLPTRSDGILKVECSGAEMNTLQRRNCSRAFIPIGNLLHSLSLRLRFAPPSVNTFRCCAKLKRSRREIKKYIKLSFYIFNMLGQKTILFITFRYRWVHPRITWLRHRSLHKGRTIRKVMGGGGSGNFRAAGIFFLWCFPWMNIFFCQDVLHEYFFFLEGTLN